MTRRQLFVDINFFVDVDCRHQVWEMLLLAKLQWDVSGVTAFDFVDHLMQKLPLCRRRTAVQAISKRTAAAAKSTSSSSSRSASTGHSDPAAVDTIRGHTLAYVSLCCTGKNNQKKSIDYLY